MAADIRDPAEKGPPAGPAASGAPREPYPHLRSRHGRRDIVRLIVAFFLSFPTGAAIFLVGYLLSLIPQPELHLLHTPQSVSLMPVTGTDWAKNRAINPNQQKMAQNAKAPQPDQPEPAPAPEEKKKPEQIPGQVVDVAPTPDTNVPDDTHRVSEYNTHVDREMQARDKTAFYKNAMPKHTTVDKPTELPGHDVAQKVAAVGQPGSGKEQHATKSKQPGQKMEIPDIKQHEKLSLARGPRGEMANAPGAQEIKGNSSRLMLQTGEGEAEAEHTAGNGGTQAHLNLSPSQSVLDRIAGAPANDHLDGVDEGESTYLNTREWKYAGFFNRVKQRVGESWDPSSALRQRDPNGQMYGYRDRHTVLGVTLDKGGGVTDLTIQKSSGVEFLDEEAMAAFKKAQPFPNPPPGLLDTDGQVKFSFGFYLEMQSGGMQLFHHSAE